MREFSLPSGLSRFVGNRWKSHSRSYGDRLLESGLDYASTVGKVVLATRKNCRVRLRSGVKQRKGKPNQVVSWLSSLVDRV